MNEHNKLRWCAEYENQRPLSSEEWLQILFIFVFVIAVALVGQPSQQSGTPESVQLVATDHAVVAK